MVEPSGILTLLTDFGLQDPYVGVVKGVLYTFAPQIQIIDLTHEIEPQNIFSGAWSLFWSYTYFPKGTVHLAVIDPGVGTERSILLAKTKDYYFIAPDNGILAPILDTHEHQLFHAYREWGLEHQSTTFHGRDLFAPLAGRLITTQKIQELGAPAKDYVKLPHFFPEFQKNKILGLLAHVDRFGNLITNIPFEKLPSPPFEIHIKDYKMVVHHIFKSYHEGKGKDFFGLKSSNGCLEIASYHRNLAKNWNLKGGETIEIPLKAEFKEK
ncbi:MAG: hypothetical protein D6785_12810 [Planctomycetota bacterium]|nr:MAG: hypothetical protein D6785_12810 [Planctomycetota bacterium]